MNDPRVGMVTDERGEGLPGPVRMPTWYFTTMGEGDPAETEVALGHAAGFLRTRLSKMLATRTTPRLRFHYDSTIETGAQTCSRGYQ
ncbi:MAG: ribosome-binding factor A [Gammaproteobacteria bacterium]|nr:ribosome-binding factor A [Gammaproteobacteria bacterium]